MEALGINIVNIIIYIILFVVLYLILDRFFLKNFVKNLEKRQQEIKEGLGLKDRLDEEEKKRGKSIKSHP